MTSDQIQEFVAMFGERAGRYEGTAENAAGQEYRQQMTIAPDGEGFAIESASGGLDGTIYYTEESRIVPAPDGGLELLMKVGGSDDLHRLELRREEAADHSFRSFVFGLGNPLDRSIYRLEVTFELWQNGDIGCRYAWGNPDGEFAPRARARMGRV